MISQSCLFAVLSVCRESGILSVLLRTFEHEGDMVNVKSGYCA